MRKINHIVIHCSATRENTDFSFEDLKQAHKARGFRTVGYHFYIRKDGSVHIGRPIHQTGAHVKGHNHDSIGIAYEGGLDANGRPKDTRTELQEAAIIDTIRELFEKLAEYQDISTIEILGHRDLSPDLDGDGVVESHEWLKQCPCFDALKEYAWMKGMNNG